jgi:endonuclease/exonuclease/phosphatase family metal-dependent hydrolase
VLRACTRAASRLDRIAHENVNAPSPGTINVTVSTAFHPVHVTLPFPLRSRLVRGLPLLALSLAVVASEGCTGVSTMARVNRAELAGVAWFAPVVAADRQVLEDWWQGVGPPVVRARGVAAAPSESVRLISWNIALGSGDVLRLLEQIRREDPAAPLVVLLQEAHRGGLDVPIRATGAMRFAARLGSPAPRLEIEELAEKAGLNLYYVPSMRNGSPLDSDEDRGNAILSNLPLEDLAAVELPFERQRRVAVAATVVGRTPAGEPWRLRVVSSHLDNLAGANRGWFVGGEFGRLRQARALVELLRGEESVVLGGDFNTWFGSAEPAYREIARGFPDTDSRDRRPTFRGLLRLDHVFLRLPDTWTAEVWRAESRYGSDHYPLLGRLTLR